MGHVRFLERFTARTTDIWPHKPAAFLPLVGLPTFSGTFATPPAMRSNALLALVLCVFAAFAAAWTKEGA